MSAATNDYHFFFASAITWCTTNPNRSLSQAVKLMDKEKCIYNVYLVPAAWDSKYDIEWYVPQVAGTKHIETIDPKNRSKSC